MAGVVHDFTLRLRDSSRAVLRVPQPCTSLRHCATTQSSASSTNANAQPTRWTATTSSELWQRVDRYRRQAKAPDTVKQLAEAAGQGRLLRVVGIHSNNLWLRFGGILVAAGCAGATYTAYKGAQSVYSFILGVRESSWALNAIVGGAVLGLAGYGVYRHQFIVSPTAVHRIALDALRQDPAVKELLRLPLTPGKPVLSIVDGGQLHFKARSLSVSQPASRRQVHIVRAGAVVSQSRAAVQWGVLPRWRSQRIQMTFPVTGGACSGVAMIDAKKRWGRHLLKVLAVDVPSKAPLGEPTRLYVYGDATTGGAAAMPAGQAFEEMRVPMQKVMQAGQELDREDEADDRELRAIARERARKIAEERAARAPKPLDAGGGMYVHEQLYWKAYYGVQGALRWMRGERA